MDPDDEDLFLGRGDGKDPEEKISAPRDVGLRSKSLPQFTFRGFVEEMGTKRRRDEARRNMWTTPGQRPLAEPPIMDWDYIFNKKMHSDAQYAALFPNDPWRRSMHKVIEGELEALYQYSQWTQLVGEDDETDDFRREFYEGLGLHLQKEFQEVEAEFLANQVSLNSLAVFEHFHLDRNGGTINIEDWIDRGADILDGEEETEQKYGHLIPPSFRPNALATFEFHHLDQDGGVERLRRGLLRGKEDFSLWPSEIQEKYGYLVPPDYDRRRFRRKFLDPDGGTKLLQTLLGQGADIFSDFGEEIKERYGYLIPANFERDELRTFESKWLDEGSTWRISAAIRRGLPVFRGWGWEVVEKYSRLEDGLSRLRRFEYECLGPDESTEQLQRDLARGVDVFGRWVPQVFEKYKHLKPANFVMDPLATFEHHFLDKDGGTKRIQYFIMKYGTDFPRSWGDEVIAKYGHLIPQEPEPRPDLTTHRTLKQKQRFRAFRRSRRECRRWKQRRERRRNDRWERHRSISDIVENEEDSSGEDTKESNEETPDAHQGRVRELVSSEA